MANVIPSRPGLVDHLGRPIDFSVLRREETTPTLGSVRSIHSGHPSAGLTPDRLAGLLRGAEAGDATRYLELAEEIEEKDLHYAGVLGTRKRQVAQLEVTVEAATEDADDVENADLIRDWLDRDTLQDELFNVQDAVGKGFSLTEIVWEFSERQWQPARLEFVLPQWTQFDPVDGKTLRLRDATAEGQDLAPFKYIDHRLSAKSGLTIRGGLARPVAWAWMFKAYAIKDWVSFCDVYGLPLRVGKYEPGASVEDKRALLRAVSDISSDAAAIIPASMTIEFVNGVAGADGSLFEKSADWWDRQVSKAVLGQTGTTDMQKGGGYAQSKTLDGVREDIEQADAKSLGASLRRDLVKAIVDLNRGPPKSRKYPRILIGRAESWDPTIMMPAIESFVRMGGKVGMAQVRDNLGIEDPGEAEDLLSLPEPAAPAGDPAAEPDPKAGGKPAAGNPAERRAAAAARPGTAGDPAEAPLRPALRPLTTPLDPVEAFAEGLDWEPALTPLVDRIKAAVLSAPSMEAAADQLAALFGEEEPTAAIRDMLARAMFEAALAGRGGLGLDG